ncbi:DUF4227 family protein [Paenibacillus beijingensis]|uniref:DUF4227 domain-containing protein n=1 Tax=Paenibacillus beijingensis TaxID=1126833 RepID=A0A0D5NPP8_9BACL|nr:DUF4227 family protein [Paenibacillus beijingensis]AJY77231.1 hypothetical protein VN24_25110 [Paenibacillus beijingensis]
MIVSLRTWLRRLLFVIVFIVLTFLAFGGYRWAALLIAPMDPYKTPEGGAVKVFHRHVAPQEGGSIADRLRWFYWYGE